MYINDLQNDDRTDCQSLQKLFLNISESDGEQFFSRILKFRELEETANFMTFPGSIKMEQLNLEKFSWIDMDTFEMELTEFQSSSIWKQKFIDLRVDLENIEKRQLKKGILERSAENELLRTWNTIPENFSSLKSFTIALLSMFLSTYGCESLFSVMIFIKSRNRRTLTDATRSSCISLKVTKYKPDVKSLSAEVSLI